MFCCSGQFILISRSSSLLKNTVFRRAANGTGMYRHFRWLQAIEKCEQFENDVFRIAVLKIPWMVFSTDC